MRHQESPLCLQVLSSDGDSALGLVASKGPLQVGGVGGDADHMEKVHHSRHIELGAQGNQGLRGDVRGLNPCKDGHPRADALCIHAQQGKVELPLKGGVHLHQDCSPPVFVQEHPILRDKPGDGCAQGAG